MARPKPSPSSVEMEAFVFETSVVAFMPKDVIIETSSEPSPKLSPPGVPRFLVSKWTLSRLMPGHCSRLKSARRVGEYPKVPGPQTICSALVAARSAGTMYASFWAATS